MISLLLKASIVIAILLAFYKVFLEKESFFALNRFYLLGCLAIAFALPFVGLPTLVHQQGMFSDWLEKVKTHEFIASSKAIDLETNTALITTDNGVHAVQKEDKLTSNLLDKEAEITNSKQTKTINETVVIPKPAIQPSTKKTSKGFLFYLSLIYLFGVVVFALNLLGQLLIILFKIIKSEDKIEDTDGIIINSKQVAEPCSFFHYIFIHPESYDYETYEQILAHEKIHVSQKHTFDLLLAEIAIILLWFNPFIWLLRKEIEKNIEYQTDDLVLRDQSIERESYQMNLLKVATFNHPLVVTTNYNQSLIKQRLLKMSAKKSNPFSYWKYAFIAPLLFMLVLFLNKPTTVFAKHSTLILTEKDAPKEIVRESSSNETIVTSIAEPPQKNQVAENTTTVLHKPCDEIDEVVKQGNVEQVKQLLLNQDSECWDKSTAQKAANLQLVKSLIEHDADIQLNQEKGSIILNGPILQIRSDERHEAYRKKHQLDKVFNPIDHDELDAATKASNELKAIQIIKQLEPKHLEVKTPEAVASLDYIKYILDNGGSLSIENASVYIHHGNINVNVNPNSQTTNYNYNNQSTNYNNIGDDNPNYKPSSEQHTNVHSGSHCKKLIEVIYKEDMEAIEKLLKTIDPNCVESDPGYEVKKTENGQTWQTRKARTPLAAAGRKGNVNIAKMLLTAGADMKFYNQEKETPLIAGASSGSLEFVQLMLDNGADLHRMSNAYGNVLIAAARKGHLPIVTYLVEKGAQVNDMNNGQGSPLNAAAGNGRLDIAKYLLNKGADIDAQNNGQGSALNAAARNGQLEMVKLLIQKGANLDIANNGQGSPLNAAARNGQIEVAKLLIEGGADLNTQNNGQGSALNAAARNGQVEMVKLLIEKGADLDIQNNGQGSALNAAARNGQVEVVKLLIKAGADLNIQTNGQGSALNAAARNGQLEVVKLLLDAGAKIDAATNGQGTALNAAARNGQNEVVKLLIKKGAKVNHMNHSHGTALLAATRNKQTKTAKILLENGADPALSPRHHDSPIKHARKNNYRELSKLFKAYEGAK